MNVSITFQPLESLAPEALNFWREQQALQDPWKGLIGTPEWFSMMASGSVKPAVVAVACDDGVVVAVIPLLFQSMAIGQKNALVARIHGGDLLVFNPPGNMGRSFMNEPEAPHPSPLPQRNVYLPPHPSPLPRGERVQMERVQMERVQKERVQTARGQMEEGWLAEVWGAIVAYDAEVEAMVLDHVDESRLPMVHASCARGSGFFLHARSKLMPHYRLILPPTYDAFRTLRSASSLKKIEGRERAMVREAGGECRLVEIRQPSDWAPYAPDINRLMNTTWQAKRLGHGFDIESCRETAERGWLRSFLLLVGDKPAAFVLGYQGGAGNRDHRPLTTDHRPLSGAPVVTGVSPVGKQEAGAVFHYEQIGHDAGLAKYSPGTTLLYRLIQRLYEAETPGCVDFGEGEAEYKKTLANQITYAQSVMVVRSRLRWRVHFWVMWMRGRAREVVKEIAEKWGVRKRVAKFLKYR